MPLIDGDIWFHLTYGKYFLHNNTLIPDHTLYSWTPATNDYIYCTWLSDSILYSLYSMIGLKGLFIFRYACIFVFITGVIVYTRKTHILTHPLTWLVCLIGLLISQIGISCKPEVFSFLFMTILTWNWWCIKNNKPEAWKYCYLFPCITIMWVNSHGGILAGCVFLALIGISEILNAKFNLTALSKINRTHLFISIILSFFALFATPYGWHYPVTLLQELIPNAEQIYFQSSIAAYNNTFSLDKELLDYGDLANVALAVMLFLVIPLLRKKKIEFSFLLTNLAFAFLYSLYLRGTFYWAPVYTFSMLFIISQQDNFSISTNRKKIILIALTISLSGVLSFRACRDAICRPSSFNYFGLDIGEHSPIDEASFIKKYYPGYNVGNTYNQGSYLMWELWPENKIMIDARHFPYRAWSHQNFNFTFNPEGNNFVERYPSDIWCVGLNSHKLAMWFYASKEWNLAYYGKNAAVFVRQGLPLYYVSEEEKQISFQSIRGPATSFYAFQFAVGIQDWATTDTIISRMEEIYRCSEYKIFPIVAAYFKQACIAYYKGDYKTTVQLLERTDVRQHLRRDGMLSLALLYLAADAWRNNDVYTSKTLAGKAITAQVTIYSLFNYGVINGYISQHEKTGISSNDWVKALEKFISTSHKDKNSTLNTIALKIIAGEYQQRPPLFLPLPEQPSTLSQ